MNMQGMGYYSYHWFGLILWFVFLILIIAGIILIIRYFTGDKNRDQKTAMEILNERYAKGELSKEEYLEKKKDIS